MANQGRTSRVGQSPCMYAQVKHCMLWATLRRKNERERVRAITPLRLLLLPLLLWYHCYDTTIYD